MTTPPASLDEEAAPLVLDVRGLLCVRVLLRLRPVIASLAPGAIVQVVTDDPAAPLDLASWCHLTGHDFLGPAGSDPGPAYLIKTSAGARQVDAQRPWALQP